MLIIPLAAVDSQVVTVSLAGQTCQLKVYQKSYYSPSPTLANEWTSETQIYVDIYVSNSLLLGGVAGLDGTLLVRDAYFGFIGDFVFLDSQGDSDPVASGLGTRYFLVYLEASDITRLFG